MPAKKKQSSLSKTKSTTTYAHGGPMQHFREMHEARKAELSKRVLPKAQESVNTNTSHSMCVKDHCPGSGDPTKGTSAPKGKKIKGRFKSGPGGRGKRKEEELRDYWTGMGKNRKDVPERFQQQYITMEYDKQ